MKYVFWILVAFAWVAVGAIVSTPYCLLAGWDYDVFISLSLIAPLYLFVLFLTLSVGYSDRAMRTIGSVLVVYSLLPIMFNTLSKVIGLIGDEGVANWLHVHRYNSLVWVIVSVVLGLIGYGMISAGIAWSRDRFKFLRN